MLSHRRDIKIEIGSYARFETVLTVGGESYLSSTDKVTMILFDQYGNQIVELTQENGGVEVDSVTGRIVRHIKASDTAQINADRGTYALRIIPGGNADMVWCLYHGRVDFVDHRKNA